MNPFTTIGLLGVAAYVIAYALLQFGKLDGNGMGYSAMNVAAASMVLFSLTHDFNLASAVTQVLWIGIGIAGIANRFLRGRSEHKIEGAPVLVANEPIPLLPDIAPTRGRSRLGIRADTAPERLVG